MRKNRLFNVLLVIILATNLCVLSCCSRKRIVYDASQPQRTPTEITVKTEYSNPKTKQSQTEPTSDEAKTNPPTAAEPTSTAAEPPKETDDISSTINATENHKVSTDNKSPHNTIKSPDDKGDQGKPSDEGGMIGAIVDEYSGLLSEGLGTLFECHIPYVYAELEADYQTGNRKSALHTLIIESGGYNTAEKLTDSAQTVDAGWVIRKNPEILVKFVNPSILGSTVSSTLFAVDKYSELSARDGWNGISAFLNRKVILLSSSLLNTEHGKLVAKLYIARVMHPELFSDLDVDSICIQVLGAGGIYYYGL